MTIGGAESRVRSEEMAFLGIFVSPKDLNADWVCASLVFKSLKQHRSLSTL